MKEGKKQGVGGNGISLGLSLKRSHDLTSRAGYLWSKPQNYLFFLERIKSLCIFVQPVRNLLKMKNL